jgi:hypothetical protein
MKFSDPILFRELPVIQKIIDDETWLEGERRGCYVPRDDRAVRERVCEVVLRVGKEIRESVTASLAREARLSDGVRGTDSASHEAA